jgi:hypothetical protein
MIEILIAVFSSLTTICVVFLKFHLERKKDTRIREGFWSIIHQQGVQSIKLNIKANAWAPPSYPERPEKKGGFGFKSEGSQLNELFFPSERFGVGIILRGELDDEDQRIVNSCIESLNRKI